MCIVQCPVSSLQCPYVLCDCSVHCSAVCDVIAVSSHCNAEWSAACGRWLAYPQRGKQPVFLFSSSFSLLFLIISLNHPYVFVKDQYFLPHIFDCFSSCQRSNYFCLYFFRIVKCLILFVDITWRSHHFLPFLKQIRWESKFQQRRKIRFCMFLFCLNLKQGGF